MKPTKARRYSRLVEYQIAQVNVGRLLAPRDSPQLAGFFAALDPVNAAADRAPGFVWRLQTEEGNATAITAFEWDRGDSHGVLINMSVWTSVEDLAAFVYGELHRSVLLQRRTWFQTVAEPTTCLWWVPAGHRPSITEAEERAGPLAGPRSHPGRVLVPAPVRATGPERGADATARTSRLALPSLIAR